MWLNASQISHVGVVELADLLRVRVLSVLYKIIPVFNVVLCPPGLILVGEPYYNEAGYEKQKGSQHAHENSRMYNEMAILKMIQVGLGKDSTSNSCVE